jgi:hypothetical protein
MHRHHVVFGELATFFAAQSSADCIINMFGFDLRQAQVPDCVAAQQRTLPVALPNFPPNLGGHR